MNARFDFHDSIIRALSAKGVRVISSTYAPVDGCFLNPLVVYNVDDNGTHRVMTYAEVLIAAM